jgi:hypothetical protein
MVLYVIPGILHLNCLHCMADIYHPQATARGIFFELLLREPNVWNKATVYEIQNLII